MERASIVKAYRIAAATTAALWVYLWLTPRESSKVKVISE